MYSHCVSFTSRHHLSRFLCPADWHTLTFMFWRDVMWRAVKHQSIIIASRKHALVCVCCCSFQGLKSLTSCPVEPNIPVYLAVEGGFGLVELLSLQWRRRKKSRGESVSGGGGGGSNDVISASTSTTFSDVVVVSFLCGWLACGTYWTARVYRPLYVPTPEEPSRWCTETVYVLALVQIVSCCVASSVAAAIGIVLLACRVYRELVWLKSAYFVAWRLKRFL